MCFGKPRGKKACKGVTPVLAEMLMIGIALTVGFALWGMVNSSAGSAQQAYSESTADAINLMNERFLIAHAEFWGTHVTIYFYNHGAMDTDVKGIWIWDGTAGATQSATFTAAVLNLTLPKGEVTVVTLDLPFMITPGHVYYVKAQGAFGSTQVYYQVA